MSCPVCGAPQLRVIAEIPQVPVFCNVTHPDAAVAVAAPRGDIVLGYCDSCGFIHNIAFDPRLVEYEQSYENSLHFSPRFAAYARALADRLLEPYAGRAIDVLEIGCGKGEFLAQLTAGGTNRCVGFDASYDPAVHGDAAVPGMAIHREFFAPDQHGERADLLLSRHVLEHIADPVRFVAEIGRGLKDDPEARMFCEVPNGLWTIRDLGIWDLIYEHCSYFTPQALVRTFTAAGFDVSTVYPEFGEQFLCLEARPGTGTAPEVEPSLAETGALADRFGAHFDAKIAQWNQTIDELLRDGQRIAIWGAGSKGVTFLNIMERGAEIAGVIDINPRKHGFHVAGTGQQIQPPEHLREQPADVVLVMNPVYEAEIRGQLADVGCAARTLTV